MASAKEVDPLKVAQLRELRTRLHMLEADRKSFCEMTTWRIKQNEENIQYARNENRQLRKRLSEMVKETIAKGEQIVHSRNYEVDHRTQTVFDLRTRINSLKSEIIDKESDIQILEEDIIELESKKRDRDSEMSELHARMKQIQSRISKAQSKAVEAQIIGKKFESILNKLKWERISWNQRISMMEAASKAMDMDFEALNTMARDAQHAKEQARHEYSKVMETLDRERKSRESVLVEKRSFAKTRAEIMDRLSKKNESHLGTEIGEGDDSHPGDSHTASSTDEYDAAFKQIRDNTGISDINIILQKFVAQNDAVESLEGMKMDAIEKYEKLCEERAYWSNKFEELKYTTVEGMGNRKYLELTESKIEASVERSERSRVKYELSARMMIEVRNGIEHLCDLCGISLNPNTSDDGLGDFLSQIETKILSKLFDIETEERRLTDRGIEVNDMGFRKRILQSKSDVSSNCRVNLTETVNTDNWPGGDNEDEGREVLTREKLKSVSTKPFPNSTRQTRRLFRRPFHGTQDSTNTDALPPHAPNTLSNFKHLSVS